MADSTITGCIATANIKEMGEVIGRLSDLPEFGCGTDLETVRSAIAAAEEVEKMAIKFRERARKAAEKLLKICRANWTAAEIEEATGYKP